MNEKHRRKRLSQIVSSYLMIFGSFVALTFCLLFLLWLHSHPPTVTCLFLQTWPYLLFFETWYFYIISENFSSCFAYPLSFFAKDKIASLEGVWRSIARLAGAVLFFDSLIGGSTVFADRQTAPTSILAVIPAFWFFDFLLLFLLFSSYLFRVFCFGKTFTVKRNVGGVKRRISRFSFINALEC